MPEKPRLRMEINNIASLFTLFISHFFLSLLTLDYWINVLEDQPHTLRSTYIYTAHNHVLQNIVHTSADTVNKLLL